jgi:hypothetical protein
MADSRILGYCFTELILSRPKQTTVSAQELLNLLPKARHGMVWFANICDLLQSELEGFGP